VDTLNTTPAVTGLPNGYYTVWIKDANNCADSATVDIGYDDCCTPYLPNAFSPNNDGKNDGYRLRYKGDVHILKFSIFNRFGERVFYLENQDGEWDGSYKGVPCEMGTYYYYLKFTCGSAQDKVLEMKGDVTLVR
jgi:gliding motility-associated-like protein